MPSPNRNIRRAVIAVANASQGTPDPERLAAAHADLAAAKIVAFIEKTLAAAPPVSIEQRRTIARLLVPSDDK